LILVDSSIWVGHLRAEDLQLTQLIARDELLHHAFVTGEVGVGSFSSSKARSRVIAFLRDLEPAVIVGEIAFHEYVSAHSLFGTGVGFVDCHLLASVAETKGVRLWTADKQLANQAERIGVPLYR
jgi:predicted nucleic acid-binding protein